MEEIKERRRRRKVSLLSLSEFCSKVLSALAAGKCTRPKSDRRLVVFKRLRVAKASLHFTPRVIVRGVVVGWLFWA